MNMDKKTIAIIVLSVALIISITGFVMASVRAFQASQEKNEFMSKIKQTEELTQKLSANIQDLKNILGKTEKEKEELTKRTEQMKKELQQKTEKLKATESEIQVAPLHEQVR